MMTTDEVRARVAEIASTADDYEAAHSGEDRLYRDVLEAISAGAPNAAELASEALKSRELRFPRVCA
jgi:hypothetical protein